MLASPTLEFTDIAKKNSSLAVNAPSVLNNASQPGASETSEVEV
jgi:hypothetical protein